MTFKRGLVFLLVVIFGVPMLAAPFTGQAAITGRQDIVFLGADNHSAHSLSPADTNLWLGVGFGGGDEDLHVVWQQPNASARGVVETQNGDGLRLREIQGCRAKRKWNSLQFWKLVVPDCKEVSTIRFFHQPYEIQNAEPLDCCGKKLELKLVIQR